MPKSERTKLLDKVRAAWNAHLKAKAHKSTRKRKYEAARSAAGIKEWQAAEARHILLAKFPDAAVELPAGMVEDHDSDTTSSVDCGEFEHAG